MTALESEIALQERKITAAFKDLRHYKFKQNLPFLILSEELPEGQSYLEYANGRVELQEVYEAGATLKAKQVRVLSKAEAITVRVNHGLH